MKTGCGSHRFPVLTALSLTGFVASCSAGYPPPTTENQRRKDASLRWEEGKRDPREPPSSAEEAMDASLFWSGARVLISKAVRAHGGWNAWLALGRIAYAREDAPGARFSASVSSEGKVLVETPGLSADEPILASLPFCLADPALEKDDLGSEIDLKAGETFERVRFRAAKSMTDDWSVVYLDASSFIVKRILLRKPGVKPVLILFLEWKPVRGVLVPVRRALFTLSSALEHRDLTRPDAVETLVLDEAPR